MIDLGEFANLHTFIAAITGAVGAVSAWFLTARKNTNDAQAKEDQIELKRRVELDAWSATQFKRLDERIVVLETANKELTMANITLSDSRAQLMIQILELRKEVDSLRSSATMLIETATIEAAKLIETAKIEAAKLIETAKIEAAKLIETAKIEAAKLIETAKTEIAATIK